VPNPTRIAARLAAVALLLLLPAGCGKPSPAPSSSPPGPAGPDAQQRHPAPDFSFTAFDGASYSLAGLKGRPIVVNFWGSRCPHCIKVAPYLEDFYQQHKDEGLIVFGVAGFDSEEALKKKARSAKITYPLAISADTGRAYAVRGIPHTFFINRQGDIASSILGAKPRAEFETALQKVL